MARQQLADAVAADRFEEAASIEDECAVAATIAEALSAEHGFSAADAADVVAALEPPPEDPEPVVVAAAAVLASPTAPSQQPEPELPSVAGGS